VFQRGENLIRYAFAIKLFRKVHSCQTAWLGVVFLPAFEGGKNGLFSNGN